MRSLLKHQNFGRDFLADMRPGIEEQLLHIVKGLTAGIGIGFIYEVLRAARVKISKAYKKIMDILFGAVVTFMVFLTVMHTDSGRAGTWVLTAMLTGFLLYLYFVSRLCRPVIYAIEKYFACKHKSK